MKTIDVIADAGHLDTITGIAEQHKVVDVWAGPVGEDGRCMARLLVTPEQRQSVLDALQTVLGTSESARIVVSPVEATLPRLKEEENDPEMEKKRRVAISREELYTDIEKGARLDNNYFLLVCLSTVVAAIGLMEDNVAVVIGAMVIAPLLGPILALAFATSLGDTPLMWRALKSGFAGLGLALAISVVIGLVAQPGELGPELQARTIVGLDSMALALASGAAAVLSMTTGLSSVLVGVMVAVALLPPTATMGMMLGMGYWEQAMGAALLLAMNIVCVNIAAKVVLLLRGIKPRTWLEREKARQSMVTYAIFWLLLLLILVMAIVSRVVA